MTARPLPVNALPRHGDPCRDDLTVDLPTPLSAVAVGAHPDDIDFGCAATLAKWVSAGCAVHYVVLTDGSRGNWHPRVTMRELASQREREQREAARCIGAASITFCAWPDGELCNGTRERWTLSRILRQVCPEVVIGHDPWRRYRLHPDHRTAGFLLTDALVAARDPLFFPDQGLPPHRPAALLLWEADVPNHVELVTGYESTKLDALLAHESQYGTTMDIAEHSGRITSDDPAAAPFYRGLLAQLGEHGALAHAPAGEAFHLIDEL